MTDPNNRSESAAADRAVRLDCLRCGARIESLGLQELRTGGSSGAAHFLLGQWAELGEGKLGVEIFVCPVCHHVELRAER